MAGRDDRISIQFSASVTEIYPDGNVMDQESKALSVLGPFGIIALCVLIFISLTCCLCFVIHYLDSLVSSPFAPKVLLALCQ